MHHPPEPVSQWRRADHLQHVIIESDSINLARAEFRTKVVSAIRTNVWHAATRLSSVKGRAKIIFPHIGSKAYLKRDHRNVKAQCDFAEKWFSTQDGVRFHLRPDWLQEIDRTADDFVRVHFDQFLDKRIYSHELEHARIATFYGSLWSGGFVALESSTQSKRVWSVECRLVMSSLRLRAYWSCMNIDNRKPSIRKQSHELVHL